MHIALFTELQGAEILYYIRDTVARGWSGYRRETTLLPSHSIVKR